MADSAEAAAGGAGAPQSVHPSLIEGVDLLCLDAGNTIIFLDHARIARVVARLGHKLTPEALIRTEGEAKRALEAADTPAEAAARSQILVDVAWGSIDAPGARGWGVVIGTAVHRAGVAVADLPAALDALWAEHVRWNLYSVVPPELPAALTRLRATGIKTAVVSNSEGMLAGLFARLGIDGCVDRIFDSGLLGVEKPDPTIFRAALQAFEVPAERALHLGDTYATDVLGARAAGLRTALIDPFGHYAGLHRDVRRVEGVVAVARALLAARGAESRPPAR